MQYLLDENEYREYRDFKENEKKKENEENKLLKSLKKPKSVSLRRNTIDFNGEEELLVLAFDVDTLDKSLVQYYKMLTRRKEGLI